MRIIIDPGKEFMGHVTSLMKRHNVIIQRSEAGNHRAQAFVDSDFSLFSTGRR